MPASDWKKTIKPAAATGAKDWRQTARPMTEDEAMAYATGEADKRYEADAPGKLESYARGAMTGGTLGFNDEILAPIVGKLKGVDPEVVKHTMRQRDLRAKQENPKSYFAGDITGSVASSAIPGMGVAKGAKLLPTMGKMAGIGAVEGYGRSTKDDLGGQAIDAGIGGALGGVMPAALKGLGKGAGFAKGLLPGSSTSPRILNKVAAQGSRISGADPHTATVYEEILNDPKKMQEAIRPSMEKVDEIPVVNQKISDAFQGIDKQVTEKFREGESEAFAKNVEDIGDFQQHLASARKIVDDFIETKKEFPTWFSNRTVKTLTNAKHVLNLNDPIAGNIQKSINDLDQKLVRAHKNQDYGAIESLEKEQKNILKKIGASLSRAKRVIDKDIKWAQKENLSNDESALREIRGKINELTHGPAGGAKEMAKVDAMYTDYTRKAEPFFEQFKGRGADGLSAKKVGDFITEAGSPYKRAEIQAYERSAKNFFEQHGIDPKPLEEAVNNLQHWKDQAAINRLGGRTGEQTGRSLLGLGLGAILGYTIDPGLGLLVAGISAPSANPTYYMRALQGTRDLIKNVGESKAAQMFGEHWPAVKSALMRQGALDEGATEKVDSAISPKVRDYIKRGGASQPGAQAGGVADPYARVKQNIQQEMSDMNPKDSTFSGRSQSVLDNLIGADKIGLDPGEKPSPTQPTKGDEDYLSRIPFLPAGTVTKLSPKVRDYLKRKRQGNTFKDENVDNVKTTLTDEQLTKKNLGEELQNDIDNMDFLLSDLSDNPEAKRIDNLITLAKTPETLIAIKKSLVGKKDIPPKLLEYLNKAVDLTLIKGPSAKWDKRIAREDFKKNRGKNKDDLPTEQEMKERIESGPKKEVFSKNEINFNDWARANYDEDIVDQVGAELGSLGGTANIKNKDLGEKIDHYRDVLKDLKDPKYEFNRRGLGMTPKDIARRKEVLDLKIKILLNEVAERMGKTFRPKKDK